MPRVAVRAKEQVVPQGFKLEVYPATLARGREEQIGVYRKDTWVLEQMEDTEVGDVCGDR